MRLPATQYAPDDEDMKYLADLNNEYPDMPTLTDGGPAPKVDQVVEPEPVAAPVSEEADDKDLDNYIGQQAAQADVEPDQTPAPAPTAQPAPIKQEQWYQPLVAKELASANNGQSKLVSKAPNWYDFDAPPEITGNGQAIMSLIAGIIQAGLAPDKKTAAAMLAGGAADAVNAKLAAPMQDYQNRLKSAQGQAQMAATLGHGQSGLGLLSHDLAERKFQHLLDNEKTKAAAEKALKTKGSPESNEIADAYIAAGIFKPEDKARLSGWQMMQGRVGAQQAAGAERGQQNWKQRYNIGQTGKVEGEERANTEWDRRQSVEQGQQIDKEDREQVKLDEQAEIPGFRFVGKRAPNIASVEKARVLSDGLASAETAADNLIDIWGKLSTRAKLTPGWLEGTLSQEDLDLVSEAKIWATNLDTAQRNLANMGVPQQFEMALIKQINPDPQGIRAFINDGSSWRAQKRVMQKTANKRMKNYGYQSESEPVEMPKHSGPTKTLPQKLKEAGAAAGETVDQAIDAGKQVVSGAVDTASKVADAAAPAAKKVLVRVNGGKWMPASEAVIEKLKQKWGNALEVQTQGQTR